MRFVKDNILIVQFLFSRMETCKWTRLISALLLAALSSAQEPDKTATQAEEIMMKMNETAPASETWNKEQTPTSQTDGHRDRVVSTSSTFQGPGTFLDMKEEPNAREDTTSMEILRKEGLLPVTQTPLVQAESSDADKNSTSVHMDRGEQLPTGKLSVLPALEKSDNPSDSVLNMVTYSLSKKGQLKISVLEDKSTKTKKLPSIIKTRSKDRKGKHETLEKNSSGNIHVKEVKERKGVTKENKKYKKSKNRKQKKEPKPTEPTPYFEDHYCPPECACYGRVVQCSDKGISKIPYGAPFNTRYLLLMNNKIDFIQLDLLNEYLSLEFLVLNNNRLTDGAIEEAFEGMPRLTRLFMDENLLSSFPADLPPSILELRINDNNVSHISHRAMNSLTHLNILSLERNGLIDVSIPSGTFNSLKNLLTIRLNSNHLETVPSNLTPSLNELFLEDNKITVIPNDVFTEPSELSSIHLKNNQIRNKGIKKKAFRNMTKLENLDMAYNLLKAIPKHLPKSLRKLILSENSISTIKKDAFFKLRNLTQIILSGNKILRIEAGAFKGLSSLDHLDISNNRLLEVPRRLPVTLRTLFLFNNQIRHIPGDSFCGKQNIESGLVLVRLENNKISYSNIDSYALRCLRGYQVVHFN